MCFSPHEREALSSLVNFPPIFLRDRIFLMEFWYKFSSHLSYFSSLLSSPQDDMICESWERGKIAFILFSIFSLVRWYFIPVTHAQNSSSLEISFPLKNFENVWWEMRNLLVRETQKCDNKNFFGESQNIPWLETCFVLNNHSLAKSKKEMRKTFLSTLSA